LLTVTAYILHFIGNLRVEPEQRQVGPLDAEDLNRAKLNWVKDIQQMTYWKKIANLHLTHPKASSMLLVR